MASQLTSAGEPVKFALETDEDATEILGPGDDDFEYDEAVISSDEIGQSFVTSSVSLARFGHYGNLRVALVILRLELGAPPGNRHRFKSANVLVQLRPVASLSPSSSSSTTTTSAAAAAAAAPTPVSVLKYWPEGRWDDVPVAIAIEDRVSVSVSGSLGVSEAGASASVTPAWERTSAFTRFAKRNIVGSSRGAPVRNQVQWALEENGALKEGVWENFKVAILVRHEGSFSIEVGFRAKVGFSAHPRKLLWPLKGRSGVRALDPGVRIGEGDLGLDMEKIDLAEFTSFPRSK